MQYRLTTNAAHDDQPILLCNDDGSFAGIPCDPDNRDYAAYLKWLEEGNTPDPAPEPPAPVEPTPAEKLAAAGLSISELKSLLGL